LTKEDEGTWRERGNELQREKRRPHRNLQTKTFRGDCTTQTLSPARKKDEVRDEKTGWCGWAPRGCRRDKSAESSEGMQASERASEKERERERERENRSAETLAGTRVKEAHIKRATSATWKRATKGIASSSPEITAKFFVVRWSEPYPLPLIPDTPYNEAFFPS